MIIGVTHVKDTPNHELIQLFDPAEAFQTKPLLGSKPILDQVLDLLNELSDSVICYGSDIPTTRPSVDYQPLLVEGASNSSSLFYVCRKNRHDMILYIPSDIMCSDWEQLKLEITEAIRLAFTGDQFVVITTDSATGPDPRLSWCSNGHFVAEITGVEDSYEQLGLAHKRSAEFSKRKYYASSGICVFPSKRVFNIIKTTMPKYWEWITTSNWADVNQLNFEQAVLENILSFKNLHSKTLVSPVNHYYQLFQFLRVSNGLKQFTSDWTSYSNNSFYDISIRHIDSHQTNVELLPGVYFKHGIPPRQSMEEIVFTIKEKTYQKFEYNIDLMRIRKLR